MRKGCDFSMSRPTVAALQAAGHGFVLRYVSTPGNPKNITASETARYRAAGIDIGIVFETTAGRALAGNAAGRADAVDALGQVQLAGGPADAVIYFAVDFDAMPDQLTQIAAYLNGAAAILGRGRVGVYGSYRVVAYAFDQKLVTFGWQTYAWSAGRWDTRAQLRQVKNAVRLSDGSEIDMCEAHADNWGQWARQGEDPVALTADDINAIRDAVWEQRPSAGVAQADMRRVLEQAYSKAGDLQSRVAFLTSATGQRFDSVDKILNALADLPGDLVQDNQAVLGALAAMHVELSDEDVTRLAAAVSVDTAAVAEAVAHRLYAGPAA